MRKLHLPVTDHHASPEAVPSVAATRARLGGPAIPGAEAGEVVTWGGDGLEHRVGVVLHAHDDEVDVLVVRGAGASTSTPTTMVRRTRRGELRSVPDTAKDADVLHASRAARAYASMREGHRVRYQDAAGSDHEAIIVEKCRYGALVERPDGTVLGVGFRKLQPFG